MARLLDLLFSIRWRILLALILGLALGNICRAKSRADASRRRQCESSAVANHYSCMMRCKTPDRTCLAHCDNEYRLFMQGCVGK